ncbi:hypothetical protein NHF46_23320 [Arthrobacter alpinus]|nr:hypothetical protein [Arthrobacter alpinus]
MQASTRAFIKRGGAACAAAAVLLGGSFTVATAAPSSDPTIAPTVASVTAEATSSAAPTSAPSATALPDGLAEAVDRDLNLSVEEFNAQGELATAAAEVQTAITKADPKALVSVAGDTIKVKASPAVAAAAKAAAGSAKVAVTTAPAASPPPRWSQQMLTPCSLTMSPHSARQSCSRSWSTATVSSSSVPAKLPKAARQTAAQP